MHEVWWCALGVGGLLGASWKLLDGFLGVLEAKLELNIVMDGSRLLGGPSGRLLGVIFAFSGSHFGVILEGFYAIVCTAIRTCKINNLLAS